MTRALYMGPMLAEHKVGMEVFERLIELVEEERANGVLQPMQRPRSFVTHTDFLIAEVTPAAMVTSTLAIVASTSKSVPAACIVVNQYMDGKVPIVVKRPRPSSSRRNRVFVNMFLSL